MGSWLLAGPIQELDLGIVELDSHSWSTDMGIMGGMALMQSAEWARSGPGAVTNGCRVGVGIEEQFITP